MFEEKTVYQQIYNVDATITIHKFIIVLKDGVEISRSLPCTKTLCPGDDYSNEDADTMKICKAVWSKSVVDAYQKLITSNNTEI